MTQITTPPPGGSDGGVNSSACLERHSTTNPSPTTDQGVPQSKRRARKKIVCDQGGEYRELFQIDHIQIGKRLRTVTDDEVKALAKSISEIGLQNPITVRLVGPDVKNRVPRLATGHARLLAVKSLGWAHVVCSVTWNDDLDSELQEIDENLVRAELSTEDKGQHLLRRRELWERREAEIQAGQDDPPEIGYRKPPHQKRGFAADTGREDRHVEADH